MDMMDYIKAQALKPHVPEPFRTSLDKEKLIVFVECLDNYREKDKSEGKELSNAHGVYPVVFLNDQFKPLPVKPFTQITDPQKINFQRRVTFVHDKIDTAVTEKMYCEIMIFETNENGVADPMVDKKIGGTEPLLINYFDIDTPLEVALALGQTSVTLRYRMMRTSAVNVTESFKVLMSGPLLLKSSGGLFGGTKNQRFVEFTNDMLLCIYADADKPESLESVMVVDTDTLVYAKRDEKIDQKIQKRKDLEGFSDDNLFMEDNMFNLLEYKRREIESRGPVLSIEEIYPFYSKSFTQPEPVEEESVKEEKRVEGGYLFDISTQLSCLKKKIKFNSQVKFAASTEKEYQQWTSIIIDAILNEEEKKDLRDPEEEIQTKIQPFTQFFSLLTGEDIKGEVIVNCFNSINLSIAEKMAVPLLTIFDASGAKRTSVDLIKYAITAEIENAMSAGTLFRRNSLSSKLVTLFFKLYGLEYLKETIGPIMEAIIEEDENLEIDAGKCTGDVEHNGEELASLIQEFIDNIKTKSFDLIPPQIRVVLAHSLEQTKKHFPESGEICVGGLLFLRFFCPAILTPHQFGLGTEPKPNAQRTLMLITKALQNVANQVSGIDNKKEAFMSVLQPVIGNNIEPLKIFLKEIATYEPLTTPKKVAVPDTIKLKCLEVLSHFYHEAFTKKQFKNEFNDKEVQIAYVKFAEKLQLVDKKAVENISRPKQDKAHHLSSAHHMQLLNRYDDSLEHFSQFIDMAAEIGGDPNLVKTAYHGRALIYMQKGDYGSALGDFTHVLKNADPSEYFESYYQAGRCYHAQGDFERAMEQYEVVLDFNPDHTNAQYYSGLIHLLQESYDSAIAAFNVVLRHNPNDVSALFSRGECYKHTGKWNFAARDFASVVALDPEAVKGYIEQAKALAKISDDRNDLEYSLYNTVVTIIQNSSCEKHNMTSKDLLDVRFKRGWLARRLGKHQQALEDFTVCIEKEVLLVESHFNRALIYRYYLHDDQKALEDLNTLLSLSPDDVSALLERGMIYFDTEHAEAATKDFEQVLELEPGNVSAIRLLDYCLVE